MATPKSLIWNVLPIFAGALAGLVATLSVSRGAVATAPPGVEPKAGRASDTMYVPRPIAPKDRAADAPDMGDMEERISALEKRTEEAGEEEPSRRQAPPDPEEWKAHHEKHHAEIVAAHEQSPMDNSWAPGARTSLLDELHTMETDNGFHVRDVDCRTKTCT